jgi:hypothetical protein
VPSKADLLGYSLRHQALTVGSEPKNARNASPSQINHNRKDSFLLPSASFVNLDSVPCIKLWLG